MPQLEEKENCVYLQAELATLICLISQISRPSSLHPSADPSDIKDQREGSAGKSADGLSLTTGAAPLGFLGHRGFQLLKLAH